VPLREDPKAIVERGYDQCALAYNAARRSDPSPELNLLLQVLAPGSRVLDIGCGGGIPIAYALSRHCAVTGVDISGAQIQEARNNVPAAHLIHGDIMVQSFAADSFDAIVSFYTLFHLPRTEHLELFNRIAAWLRPGGHLLVTVAQDQQDEDVDPDFFGSSMYWSHFDLARYEEILSDLGFTILHRGVVGHGYRDVPGLPPERHPVLFGRLDTGSSVSTAT